MLFIVIAVIVLLIAQVNRIIDAKRFVTDMEPYFRFMMEDDYVFFLNVKYGGKDLDVEKLYSIRVRNGLVVTVALIFVFFTKLNYLYVLLSIIGGFVMFKVPYFQLKSYYKNHLGKMDAMLPYYLKSIEILVQHYTVPVALAKSIDSAPEIFQNGLKKLVAKVDAGDQSVDPYMQFAKDYPVRDSMRMMRLLYRLSLGSQENKQEQLNLFSRNVSSLQNKAREQKYQARLEKMENKTMTMLFCTGGGVLGLLLLSMMSLMGI